MAIVRFDATECVACGAHVPEAERELLPMGERELTLCAECARDPLRAAYKARQRARRLTVRSMLTLDIAELLDNKPTTVRPS
jgi:NAD-dependent SIR2 family protein deacetylase